MADSIDIILNAFDHTGPAVASAVTNVNQYATAVVQANATTSAASAGGGGLVSMFSTIATGAATATLAAAALGGIAIVVYRNWSELVEGAAAIASGIADAFMSLTGYVSDALVQMSEGTFDWVGLFDDAMAGIVAVLAAIEFAFQNWADVASLAGLSVLLGIVTLSNSIQYYFTEVIPAYLTWFGENWQDVFTNLWEFVKTVVTNMHENLVRFFTAVFEYLQGNGFNFEWVGLTEGFQSTLKALPEIAEREIGGFEGQLRKDVDQLGASVGQGMMENINKRVEQYRGAAAAGNRTGFFAGWAKEAFGFGLDDIAGALGGGKKQSGGGSDSLPTLAESRFLTGVAESTRDQLQQQVLEEQKKGNDLLGGISNYMLRQLPAGIRDGVKAGISQAGNVALVPLGAG